MLSGPICVASKVCWSEYLLRVGVGLLEWSGGQALNLLLLAQDLNLLVARDSVDC
jgi:hypothetical protein